MWRVYSYNTSDKTLGGDFPIEPGGQISAVYEDSYEEAAVWFKLWTTPRAGINGREILLIDPEGEIVEQTFL